MTAKITFFPVDNGDMTLLKLFDSTNILIDINIRGAADDENNETCDVGYELRKRLKKDKNGRPFVDVFVLSHPDKDHCGGLINHFHLGTLEEYVDDPPEGEDKKIVIREIWSSPLVYKRASKNHKLCKNAKEFNTETRRRINAFKEGAVNEGDKVLIIGEDDEDSAEEVKEINYKIGDTISKIDGKDNTYVSCYVLGPYPKQEIEEEEEKLGKNHSSIILQFTIAADDENKNACLYLTGGDSEVAIWEKIWDDHSKDNSKIKYDVLLVPHHCSWHTLSNESWDNGKGKGKESPKATAALSQANDGAFLISSSKPIKNSDDDPPCIGAKDIYKRITEKAKGDFICTGETPNEDNPEPVEITITSSGPQGPAKKKGDYIAAAGILTPREPLSHG